MTHRDYRKEVGITNPKKTLPRPVAFVILAAVAVGVSFGVAGVVSESREHHAAEKSANKAAAATAPAPETPAATPVAPAPTEPAR